MADTRTILFTGAALLAGALVWLGLCLWQRRHPLDNRSLCLVVIASGLLCRMAAVSFTPAFYAPDEQSHFNYVRHLVEQRTFPVLTSPTPTPDNEWENHQPPLYYLLLVPACLIGRLFPDPLAASVLAMRGCSVMLWLLNVWLVVRLLRGLGLADRFVPVFVLAMVCLLPTYVFVSSAINNDNLLITLATALLWLVTERNYSIRQGLWLGLGFGLALLTKQSAIVLAPAIVVVPLLEARARKVAWPQTLKYLGVALGVASLIYLPWAIRNWVVYGWLSPEHMSPAHKVWPNLAYGLASTTHNVFKTFWSVSGISNDVGYPFPLIGMALLALCFATTQMGAVNRPNASALNWSVNRSLMIAFACAALVNALLVLRFGYLFGMGQGRHLFAVLCPLALFLAAGLRRLPVPHLEIHAAGYWLTYALTFVAFSLCRFPR